MDQYMILLFVLFLFCFCCCYVDVCLFVSFWLCLLAVISIINLLYTFSGTGLFYLRYAACERGLGFYTIQPFLSLWRYAKACVAHMQCQYT